MASPEPSRDQCYLVFEGDFPSEGGWIGDDPDPENPAGREAAEWLLTACDPALTAEEIWNEENFGWGFNVRAEGISVNVLVQFAEPWLVIVTPVSLLPGFLRGAKYAAAVHEVCLRIHRAAIASPRVSKLRWYTRAEYDALGPGDKPL